MAVGLRQITIFALKALVTVGALAFVVYKLTEVATYDGVETTAWDLFTALPAEAATGIWLPALMVLLNIGLEAAKWQILIKEYYPAITFIAAFRAVLAGMTTGVFTPNRIGEYAGRVFSLQPGHRLEATVLTFFDRLSQMFVTLIAGLIAMGWLILSYRETLLLEIFGSTTKIILVGGLLITFLLLICLLALRPALLLRLITLVGIKNENISLATTTIRDVNRKKLFAVTALSAARYAVFSLQYFLMMRVFGYEMTIGLAMGMIALVFLVKSLIPFIGLSELGMRESVAMVIMGWFGVSTLIAFGSTLILYVLNILLPTLAGIPFVGLISFPAKNPGKK